MGIANILTLMRIALIPIFVLAFYLLPDAWARPATAGIFALAAITDGLDGWLARRLKQTSAFGAFLDPVADKLMVAVALVLLVQSHPSAWFAVPAAIIIGREIAVSALREWMAEIGGSASVAVSLVGKLKTMAQMLAVLLLLFHASIGPFPTFKAGIALLYISATLTLWSMIIYLHAAWPRLTYKKPG